jgi:hypothetical protein
MATTNPYYSNPYAIQNVSGYQPNLYYNSAVQGSYNGGQIGQSQMVMPGGGRGMMYDSGGQKVGMTTAEEAKDFNDKNPNVLGGGGNADPKKMAGAISAGEDAFALGVSMYQQGHAINSANIGEMTQKDQFNPYYKPVFDKQATPEQFSKEASANRTMGYVGKGAGAGAKIGTLIAPGIGTAIGAGAGALIGAGVGLVQGSAAAKKRDEFESAQKNRYKNYIGAQNTYYDNFDKQNMVSAQNRNLGMRGQNYIPAYNSSIYGFV